MQYLEVYEMVPVLVHDVSFEEPFMPFNWPAIPPIYCAAVNWAVEEALSMMAGAKVMDPLLVQLTMLPLLTAAIAPIDLGAVLLNAASAVVAMGALLVQFSMTPLLLMAKKAQSSLAGIVIEQL